MTVILSLVEALVLIGADQIIKLLVIYFIPYQPYGAAPIQVIPGVFGLNHVRNTGGAWSLLGEHTWLLTILSTIVSLVILYLICRQKAKHPVGNWALILIFAGAVGNLIDRIRLQYVVDMFQFLFFDFPVFNFADICITTGCVLLCVYILFFFPKQEKGRRLNGDHSATS